VRSAHRFEENGLSEVYTRRRQKWCAERTLTC
jgi:hypothetical protein